MKSFYSSLALIFLPAGLSLAQPSSANKATTQPGTTTLVSSQQQERYDQYHGITKKPATSAPVATPTAAVNRVETQPAASSSKSQPVAMDSPAQSMTRENISRPERIAKDGSASGFRIGVRGGVTYPYYTETIVGVDPVIGFTGGVVLNFGKGTISFQPEVNYSRYSNKVTSFGFTDTEAIDAIEVPLFLKISSGTYAGSRFFVNIGPYATYLASASVNGKKVDLSNATGRFGFGGAVGIGAALKAGPGHVTIEVRGLYSLGNTDSGFSTDSKTVLGQGALGYIFPL